MRGGPGNSNKGIAAACLAGGLVLVAAAMIVQAWQPVTAAPLSRGRQHERLDVLEGTWQMSGKSRGLSQDGKPSMVELTGTVRFDWVLEGTWLFMRLSETVGQGHQFHHVAMITWDTDQGRYVRRVFSSTSTRDPLEVGRWIDDETLEFTGSFEWDDGKTYGFRNRFRIVSDSEIAMTLHQRQDGGEEFIRTEATMKKMEKKAPSNPG